jgi:hypothetical protein
MKLTLFFQRYISMKNRCSLIVCFLMCRLAYADESSTTSRENIVDPLGSVWQELENDMREGNILKAANAVFLAMKLFKEGRDKQQVQIDEQKQEITDLRVQNTQQQAQINEQKQENELLRCAHEALQQKYTEDSAQQATMLKGVQQAFMRDNRFSGG